jgi:hypothetical protein
MKRLFLFLAFGSFLFKVSAQVSLEHVFSTTTQQALGFQELWLTDLGNGNYKYVIYTYGFTSYGRLDIYNPDYSPYMLNVTVPVVSDSTGYAYRVGYVTTTLFDCDSTNIEFAVMLDTPHPNAYPNTAIYRTDGTLIFSKDSVGTYFCVGCGSGSWETHPIMNTSTGAKMYLWYYGDSLGNFDQNGHVLYTLVYGLCGTLPERIDEINQLNSFVRAFPNPSSSQINFEISAPSHMEHYELTILNSAFQPVKTHLIKGENVKMIFNGEGCSSGVYFYSLRSKNKVFQTGKFVLSK